MLLQVNLMNGTPGQIVQILVVTKRDVLVTQKITGYQVKKLVNQDTL